MLPGTMTRVLSVLLLLIWSASVEAQPLGSELAESWRAGGQYFAWTSTVPENAGRSVLVFYTCIGDVAKPTIVALHGFPTSSLDFRGLARELQPDYRTCTLDFPGYGVSDKPSPYRYTLADDAALVWAFVTKVVPLREFILLSHDRGDSVALNLLLANLTEFQKRMLDPATAPPAAQFGYQNGVAVIPATIQYLNERKEREVTFLETLSKSAIPATLMWGVHDLVAPVRVADYVFTTALASRRAPSAFWLMPCGHHYVQHDQPADMARLIRATLARQASGAPPQQAPFNLTPDACGPVLVRTNP